MNRSKSIITLTAMMVIFSISAFADVKVKSKQTVGGQSYESTTYIKGKRQRSETMGGMVNLTQCDLKRGVQLNTNSQTYMVTPFAASTQTTVKTSEPSVDKDGVAQTGGRVTTTITTKDTGERKQMFGYAARRLIITIETVSSPNACSRSDTKMQTDGWYIDAAFALDCDGGYGSYGSNNPRSGGCQDKYDVKTIGTAKRGFAVYEKTSMLDTNGRETYAMISEVVEFSQATLDANLFDVPAGFREVSDASQMYTGAAATRSYPTSTSANSGSMASTVKAAAKTLPTASVSLGPKKPGTIRIGVASVKTGAVGEGLSAADLSTAVQNTVPKHLNVQNIEVVPIEAKLASAINTEASSKECDFLVFLTASHKKGGGGFAMFKSLAPMISSVVPLAEGRSSQSVITVSNPSAQVKNKDELTLDVRLDRIGGGAVLQRSIKVKAKSNGEDIISLAVELAAKGIIDSVKDSLQ